MSYVIQWEPGNYYRRMTAIGPQFGASLEEAARFDTKDDAASAMGLHWAFGSTEIVEVTPEER
jgi:hypothetical protein